MGTRSLTVIQDEVGNEIVVMYKQYDGYPEGYGEDLKKFLSGMVIVNGIGSNTPKKAANGMYCLAAQIVAHFKEDIGEIYLYPAGTRDCMEEYIYTVYMQDKQLMLKCKTDEGIEVFNLNMNEKES